MMCHICQVDTEEYWLAVLTDKERIYPACKEHANLRFDGEKFVPVNTVEV